MPNIIDSYTGATTDNNIMFYNGGVSEDGQSFSCGGNYTLDSCVFKISKSGTPTGNYYAQLYSHTGAYGSTGDPDTLLATSEALDAANLSTTPTDKTFAFSGANRVSMSATYYYIVVKYLGGDASNMVMVRDCYATHTHSGCEAYKVGGGAWSNSTAADIYFIVYGNPVPLPKSGLIIAQAIKRASYF